MGNWFDLVLVAAYKGNEMFFTMGVRNVMRRRRRIRLSLLPQTADWETALYSAALHRRSARLLLKKMRRGLLRYERGGGAANVLR